MSKNMSKPTPKPVARLSSLSSVELNQKHSQLVKAARANCSGPAAFRHRVQAEVHEVCALAQLSGRLFINSVDPQTDLRMVVDMDVLVPCLRDPAEGLRIIRGARIGLIYHPDALITPQPGYAFARILGPGPVWHPNVSPDHNQVLCLGTSLPAGTTLKEVLLMTYGALSMQSIQIDATHPAGVMNLQAAEWWQLNTNRIPLSREPFIK